MPENFDQTQLSDLFQIAKGSICPFLYPDEEFVHHSLPALDATGGPALEFGHQIESNKTLLVSPSILVSKLNPRTSRVTVVDPSTSPKRHCCSTEFIAYTPTQPGLSLGYYSYLFGSDHFRTRLQNIAIGTTNSHVRANPSETLTWQVPYPPKPEQAKIAEVLSVVDRTIEQTEALIAKQQRIKAGLVQDLLTRGIDENGTLRSERTHTFKDSSLGPIPARWDAKPLSTIMDLQVGYAFKSSWFTEDGVRLLRGENVGTGAADWGDMRCLPHEIANRFPNYQLSAGDSVIGMDRTFTKQGVKVSVLDKDDIPCLLVQRVGRFVPIEVPRQFGKLLIQSRLFQTQLQLQQKGMDIPHLSKSEILTPIVPIPDTHDEMELIASCFEAFRSMENETNRILTKLHLIKTALMQVLLTGKKRVTPLLQAEELVK